LLDAFFEAICRVGIFMICAQAVVHFRPQESYEKYLKLIVSVMILLQLFLPIGGVFLAGGKTDVAKQLTKLTQSIEEGRRLAEEKAAETEEMLEQMTLEEVQKRIEAQEQQQNMKQPPESIQVEPVQEIVVGGES